MKIVWSESAEGQVLAIRQYYAAYSPAYARVICQKISARVEQLVEFPLSGRMVPEYKQDQVREAIVPPYRVLYHVQPHQLEILAVVHGRQDLGEG